MILSHAHQYVFIKTRKTGATSVEIALSRAAGDDDVITPITPVDEYLRVIDGRPCQNYSDDPDAERAYIDRVRGSKGIGMKKPPRARTRFYNFMSIAELRAAVDVRGYHTFAIERHPYDKAVSFANFHLRIQDYRDGKALTTNTDELRAALTKYIISGKLNKIRNFGLYAIDGEVAVDRVIQYERLADELPELELPRTKVGARDRAIPAAEILTPDHKAFIQELCRAEFELLEYPS